MIILRNTETYVAIDKQQLPSSLGPYNDEDEEDEDDEEPLVFSGQTKVSPFFQYFIPQQGQTIE